MNHDYNRCEIWRNQGNTIDIYFESKREVKLTRKLYDWDEPEEPEDEEPLFDYDYIPF